MSDPTRRQVLGGASALAALGWSGCSGSRPPPIIFFFIDQLRADAIGASGNRFVRTPHIDALAAESVRFETCVTNAPVCRPARVTMMTGRHVADHGVWTNRLEPDPRQLASHVTRLRDEAGYHTMVVGKTHLHNGQGHFDAHLDRLRQWGFSGAVELPDPQQTWVNSAYSDWLSATTPKGQSDKAQRWADYIARYTWDAPPPDADPWRLSVEDQLDTFCARTAAQFVRDYQEDSPLYLQVNFPGPHKPFDPPSLFTEGLDPWDAAMPMPILEIPREPTSPINQKYQSIKLEDWTEESARALRVRYFGKVGLVDDGVGRVMEALRESGMLDEAWIVLMADHGELLADHMMTGKVLVYEPAVRVPLLIRPPGGVQGWVDDSPVDLMDVVSTLLSAGGLDPAGMGDRDLTERLMAGPNAPYEQKTVLFENMEYVGLRTDTLKFGWDLLGGAPAELFDMAADPEERFNLIDDPARRADVVALVDELRRRRTLPVDTFRG